MSAIEWIDPPKRLTLPAHTVHLWRAALNLTEAQLTAFGLTLNAEEQARAARLRIEAKRRAFVVARAVLRNVLARYLDLSPQQVQFSYNLHGKPELGASQATGLQFNLAHSGDLALIALAWGRPIGVDLERHHPVEAVDRLVDRYFAPGERAAFHSVRPEQQLLAFFAGWTRKEAYVKACGAGLTLPLDQFEVSLKPGVLPELRLNPLSSAAGDSSWTLLDVEPVSGYSAALAVPGPVGAFAAWQWTPTG